MRGKWLLVSGAAVLAAVAAGALLLLRQRAAPTARSVAVPSPATVVGPEISLPGTIRAQSVVPVPAPIEGTIETLLVDAGQPVYEGQSLGRIKNTGLEEARQTAAADAESAQARLSRIENEMVAARLEASRARADAVRAQSECDRTERAYLRQQMLLREGATPRLTFERAAAEFQSAKTERDTRAELARVAEDRFSNLSQSFDAAQATLKEKSAALDTALENAAAMEILSPVDGFVVARTKQPGDEVTTEVRDLFQIAVDISALEAVVEPPPPALARIHPGQQAFIQIAEFPDAIPGRVKSIQGAQVIVEFASPNPALLPGATAQVRIKLT
jgi:multidrug resistance efflux pump